MPKGIYNHAPSRIVRMKNAILNAGDECINWDGAIDSYGYASCWYEGKTHHASRVAYLFYYGSLPSLFACHTCDNRKCINPRHIFDASHKDNMKDGVRKRRFAFGANAPTAKSKSIDPDRVFDLYKCGFGSKEIADYLGYSQPYISRIINRRRCAYASDTA